MGVPTRAVLTVLLTCTLGVPWSSAAQNVPQPIPLRSRPGASASVVGWTVAGAGVGFGIGFFAGLHVFNEALYAERKILITAAAGAAAGAFAGYLIGKARRSSGAAPQIQNDAAPRRAPREGSAR